MSEETMKRLAGLFQEEYQAGAVSRINADSEQPCETHKLGGELWYE